ALREKALLRAYRSPRGSGGRLRDARLLPANRGGHELTEERVRGGGLALELGVELHAHEEGVVAHLHNLDEVALGVDAPDDQPRGLEPVAVGVVELVAVAVALLDRLVAVSGARAGAGAQRAAVGAQAQRAALL